MITNIPDRERALQAEVDELREGVKRYKEMADMASAEIAALTAELARLRAQVPVGWIGPSGFTHNTATNRMWMRESPKLAAKLSPVYAAPPAQPAEQQAQTVCKRTLIELDARLRECSIVGASAADAYDTFYQHMVETALAAQPAEPVQRLSDEQIDAILHEAGVDEFAAIPIEYDRQVARAIESALQPGWRPEWPAFVEYWTHESHLQTFADRERFRAAAKAMLEAAPKATK
jgi:hypothetical protein